MAITVVHTGSFGAGLTGTNALTVDEQANVAYGESITRSMKVGASGESQIEGAGGYSGTMVATTGSVTMQLAHATDPFQGGGDVAPAQGYAPSGNKLYALYFRNTHASNTVTITVAGANGLAGLDWAAGETIMQLYPYGVVAFSFPSGSSALTPGSNDGVTFTASSGTPGVIVTAVFGA